MSDHPAPNLVAENDALRSRLNAMTDPGFSRPELHAEDAIISRRSIRAFQDEPVPEALMRRILEAARWAPSGSNIQPRKEHEMHSDARKRYKDAK